MRSQQKFEDTKRVIRIYKLKDRQENAQKKKNIRTSNYIQNTTQKTKDWVAQTPLKTGVNWCSGRVSRSCSTVPLIILLLLQTQWYAVNETHESQQFYKSCDEEDNIYIYLYWCNLRIHFYTIEGPSWSYGNWIYNYLCNQCLSPPTLWVRTPLRWGRLHTTLCDKDWQWLATGRWKPPGTPVASTTKTDHHDITEILLKVALNIIPPLFY